MYQQPSSGYPTQLRNPDEFRDFNKWLNDHSTGELSPYKYRFSFFDLDGVFYSLRKVNEPGIDNNALIQLLEVKTHGARLRDGSSQKTGLLILDTMLKNSNRLVANIETPKGLKMCRLYYVGFHTLRLSNSRPDNSDSIEWDNNQITLEKLYKNLRMDTKT